MVGNLKTASLSREINKAIEEKELEVGSIGILETRKDAIDLVVDLAIATQVGVAIKPGTSKSSTVIRIVDQEKSPRISLVLTILTLEGMIASCKS